MNKQVFDKKDFYYVAPFRMRDVIAGASDDLHPAFAGGKGFWVAKYPLCAEGGKFFVRKGGDPAVGYDLNEALDVCSKAGARMMTALEWGAITLQCFRRGFLPRGNTDYGKGVGETEYVALPTETNAEGKTIRTAAGTGPKEWNHDGTENGIADLVGNVWEWQNGLKLKKGVLLVMPDPASDKWKTIDASSGEFAEENAKNAVRIAWDGQNFFYTGSEKAEEDVIRHCPIADVYADETVCVKAKEKLLALALLLPEPGLADGVSFYANAGAAERVCFRGGKCGMGVESGLYKTCLDDPPTLKTRSIGFRLSLGEQVWDRLGQ